MNCCAECFGDYGLRQFIIPPLSTSKGQCPYCKTADVSVLPPRALAIYFESLVSAYRQDAAGKLLVQWFREDWALFKHPRMGDTRAKRLLAEVLKDEEIVNQHVVPIADSTTDSLTEWEKLRDELRYNNRYFPRPTINFNRLEELLFYLRLGNDELPPMWYRARIQTSNKPFSARKMGAPPKELASHGRANPAGIPYLYLGSNPVTAVSEIRPHTGESACVANFTAKHQLSVIDLRSPRKTALAHVSPFLLDSSDVGKMRNDLLFLERLGEELTRPVLPQAAAIDYTPSQYLCEFIKKCGYHGVVYRSSVSDGINLALFDPKLARCGTIDQYDVDHVVVEISSGKR